jgi:hypothetical protein
MPSMWRKSNRNLFKLLLFDVAVIPFLDTPHVGRGLILENIVISSRDEDGNHCRRKIITCINSKISLMLATFVT